VRRDINMSQVIRSLAPNPPHAVRDATSRLMELRGTCPGRRAHSRR
jgi:hypothetical protein